MYLEIFKWIFIIISVIIAVMLVLLDRNITKRMEPMKASEFVSFVTAGLLIYVMLAFILAIKSNGISRFVMLLFAIFPFIAGHFATYKSKRNFTLVQILVIISSVVYTLQI